MQQAYKSQAFLLRRVRYGESDLILTLLCRDHGKISCLARHAMASKKRFGFALQPFCKFEALWRGRGGGLAQLESAMPVQAWPGLLADLSRMSSAWRLLELANALEEPGAIHAGIFDTLDAAFGELSLSESPGETTLLAEARMLDLSGWSPRLDACVGCREEFPFVDPRLSLAEGGLLCANCRTQGGTVSLGPAAVHALQDLFAGRKNGQWMEARQPLRRFVEYQLGKALKMDSFELRIQEGP